MLGAKYQFPIFLYAARVLRPIRLPFLSDVSHGDRHATAVGKKVRDVGLPQLISIGSD